MNILNMTMLFVSNTRETGLSLTPGILFLMTSVTTPGAVFTRFHFFVYFVSWFVLIDLYMSGIQSRRISFLKLLVEKSLELFYPTFAVIFISLLWTALKPKIKTRSNLFLLMFLDTVMALWTLQMLKLTMLLLFYFFSVFFFQQKVFF